MNGSVTKVSSSASDSAVSRLQGARDGITGLGEAVPASVDAGEVQEDISGAVYYIFSKMSLISTSIEQASTGLQNANSNFEAQDAATAEATPGRAAR